MSLTALTAILGIGEKVIDKLFPDPHKAAEAKLELIKLQQAGEFKALEADLEIAKGQMTINQEEARSEALFKSGWRPFIGWTCGIAFSFNFLILPTVKIVLALNGIPLVIDPLDLTEMMPVLLGMLGLGGFRTYEKIKRKQNG